MPPRLRVGSLTREQLEVLHHRYCDYDKKGIAVSMIFPKGFVEGKNNRTKAVTSRAQFYEDVYRIGEQAGVVGFAFWGLGWDIRGSSYQVNPDTPAVWQAIL
jgi:hypothetical protein